MSGYRISGVAFPSGLTTGLLLFSFTFAVLAQSQPPGVIRIKVEGCATPPNTRFLTGFILNLSKGAIPAGIGKRPGILTALHGVLGDCRISGETNTGLKLGRLHLDWVDIENDVALLRSKDILPEGLPFGSSDDFRSVQEVRVSGYPDIPGQVTEDHVKFLNPRETRLYSIADGDMAQYLRGRRSPELKTEVLSLAFGQKPGLSGAPILHPQDNRVLAIAGSGLKGGTAGLNWAVRLDQVKLQDASLVEAELKRIGEITPFPHLFDARGVYFIAKIGDIEVQFAGVPAGVLRQEQCTAETPNCVATPWTAIAGESIEPFWIARTETTNEQYSECVHGAANKQPKGAAHCKEVKRRFSGPNAPVAITDVKQQAQSFCESLMPPGRLPTPAEWRFAALEAGWAEGGTKVQERTCEMNLARLWKHRGCGEKSIDIFPRAAETGRFPANRVGLLDMFGNLAEVVINNKDEKNFVALGGSFASSPKRDLLAPVSLKTMRKDVAGFRCVIPIIPIQKPK